MHKPVLGVLGGVGPLATAYFMELVIKRTPAMCDQDNIPMIVFNDPQIPDRTAYILDRTKPDPLPEMVKVVRWLEDAGADYIAIPCNTAHYFYDAIAAGSHVPVLNIMRETAAHVSSMVSGGSGRVGLLATEGTIASGVFQHYLDERGLTAVVPTDEERSGVIMPLIYDRVKRNLSYDEKPFMEVARRLHDEEGCDAVIVGCTELSVVYQDLSEPPAWLVDAMDVLASRCVEHYLALRQQEGAER